jgi:asparagine N-glycosylation enzyme membrane subunit Stt3
MIPLMALMTIRQKQSVLAAVLGTVLVLGAVVWVWNNAPWLFVVVGVLVVLLVWAGVRKPRKR